jgi:hypothetical protein
MIRHGMVTGDFPRVRVNLPHHPVWIIKECCELTQMGCTKNGARDKHKCLVEPSSEEASQSGAQVSGVKWCDGSSEGQSISFDFHLLRLTSVDVLATKA